MDFCFTGKTGHQPLSYTECMTIKLTIFIPTNTTVCVPSTYYERLNLYFIKKGPLLT